MGLKRRNRANAEFNMSSLTDIIFLLLIFFMLTANFVQIHPFDLPESDAKTVAATDVVVSIDKAGTFTLNNEELSSRRLESSIRTQVAKAENKDNVTITIVAEKGVPFVNVKRIIEIAGKLRVKAILATQPRE